MQNLKVKNVLERIKAERESLGYTQEYMAYKLQMNQSTYHKLENGKLKLRIDQLYGISETLGVELLQILGKE